MVDITIQGGFPRSVLISVGLMLAGTIALAGITHATNAEHVTMPPTAAVATVDLAFKDLPDGGITIKDAATGRLVSNVAPQSGHFIRGIMRALVLGHRRAGQPDGMPFRLTRWADGRLTIADPSTRESFELEAFGSTNEQVFAALLDSPRKT